VSRKSATRRWESKFGRFVKAYGVNELAVALSIHPTAVYHWISGARSPHPSKALRIQSMAKRRGTPLTLDQIYQHFREVGSERYATSPPKPQPARA
jgi:DNA-binding transcriptional regulator YdaS (Cro superfamily)